MTDSAASRGHGDPMPYVNNADNLTHVELIWVAKKIEYWIRFGREVHEQVLDRSRSVLAFRPDSIFAFVRWAANDFGTVISRIDIVRAVAPGEPYQTLPFVRPGGDILLKIEGWAKVERVLRHIDAIEAVGIEACDVAPDHWRHVANRMLAHQEPLAYTSARHNAWLKRREIEG
ncbi:DUF2840 domain-containing protein [Rhizobium sp. P44RR-XXIV]|uniref:DUF2840 domain-containing protein n=1 Tax=Rhizobium sp. P44RR-XXIV TaxID=1921145 RepID=UPI0009864AAC|nr:DUF2840 domain-containing protein [Rhizobium sp. P44RR-XXIV]TIX93094.1 DUF2840 domain-containing protein [Rhizobium sp. P44RR-XXIV]